MRIVTSFSRDRVLRQQYCLETWLGHGYEVVAMQSADDPPWLRECFRNVDWRITANEPNPFGKPARPKISKMVSLAAEGAILFLNSDIHLTQRLSDWDQPQNGVFRVGVRHDRDAAGKLTLRKYGIDAFLFTPEMADTRDFGYAIGCPTWDYWIVWEMWQRGFEVLAEKRPYFIHDEHPRAWDEHQHSIGVEILTQLTGRSGHHMTKFILDVTGRK